MRASAKPRTEPPRRSMALSKESRVRVDGSKKSVPSTRPWRLGGCGVQRGPSSNRSNARAASSRARISSLPKSAAETTLRPAKASVASSCSLIRPSSGRAESSPDPPRWPDTRARRAARARRWAHRRVRSWRRNRFRRRPRGDRTPSPAGGLVPAHARDRAPRARVRQHLDVRGREPRDPGERLADGPRLLRHRRARGRPDLHRSVQGRAGSGGVPRRTRPP